MTPAAFIARYRVPCFYHFTDTRNLDSIRKTGALVPWANAKNRVVAPGGNQWSHDADTRNGLDRYVHLALLDEHPMEYAARQDGRIEESRFLGVDAKILLREGVLFCPDVSNKAGVIPIPLDDAVRTMDFEVVYGRTNWKDPDIQHRRQLAKKYELLVPGSISIEMIQGI